jgi:hypothetical protein
VDKLADVDAQAGVVAAHITAALPPAIERYGRFVTHLLGSEAVRSEAKTYLLANLTTSLKRSTGVHADRLRESAFSSSVVKDLLLGTQSETCDPTSESLWAPEELELTKPSYRYFGGDPATRCEGRSSPG